MVIMAEFYNSELQFVLLVKLTHSYLRGGGRVHPDYFVKLDFEIAVDQQTRARERTFEGVPDSG